MIPLPSLSRNDPDFWPTGGYWRGSAWLPTTYMVVKALDGRGDYALARSLARDTILAMLATFREVEPHTIWECYSPTENKPGTYAKKPGYSRSDFCGWSALGPISLFIEDVIGVKQADAFANRLVCDFPAAPAGRVGVSNYRFGKVVCDIVATAGEIAVSTNRPFTLVVGDREFAVVAGENRWERRPASAQGRGNEEAAKECGGAQVPCLPTSALEIPAFGDWRDSLPHPVYEGNTELVDLYYRAWEIAHSHIVDVPGLPTPRYMDCGHRSDRIWIWDTCFMAHYCKYAPHEFPGIESLENFYSLLLDEDGRPLPKVVGNRWCGEDEGKMLDFMVHHPDNPPLFAWTELCHAFQTGDKARLEKVYLSNHWLQRWFDLFDSFNPDAPKPHGTCVPVKLRRRPGGYNWGGIQSGMDNTPRGRTAACPSNDPAHCPDNPDLLWIDALAQQGLSALCISRIASLLGRDDDAERWRGKWEDIRGKVNRNYWDEADGFYYDILETDGSKVKVSTLASYWPLLAEMPSKAMADRLVGKLSDAAFFG